MNRKELKENVKEMIKGNKWYLIKPLLLTTVALTLFMIVVMLIASLFKPSNLAMEIVFSITMAIVIVCSLSLSFGYAYYCLSFVRETKIGMKEMIQYSIKNIHYAIILSLLVSFFELLGSVLLVVPGIIVSLGLYFYREVFYDNQELTIWENIKKSWLITKGHKLELFLLDLSFIGWILLSALTLGILYIWIMPYMVISFTLFYIKLIAGNN